MRREEKGVRAFAIPAYVRQEQLLVLVLFFLCLLLPCKSFLRGPLDD